MKSMRILVLPLLGALTLGGCDLDLADPNNPVEEPVITSRSGIRHAAVGLQATYSNQLVDPVYTVGLATDELGAASATFQSFKDADAGETIDNTDGPSTNTWGGMYVVIRNADVLIDNAANVGYEADYVSGLLALGKFYKGLAFGQLYQIYPAAPIAVGTRVEDPPFVSRAEVIGEALDLLAQARQHMASNPPPSEFFSEVLAPGFDLENSIHAMEARFALMAEDYDRAFDAAGRVDLDAFSEFRFGSLDPNPLWGMWYGSGNAYQLRARDDWREDAQSGDERVEYWVQEADIAGAHRPLDHVRRYMDRSASYPVYLPDEMKLIRAEVYARRGQLGPAITLLNEVRTQCSSPHNEPTACLPPRTFLIPTQGAVLDAILYERRYELYLQAVRWSDLRRFDEPMKYDFMPVPITECDRNANAPSDLC